MGAPWPLLVPLPHGLPPDVVPVWQARHRSHHAARRVSQVLRCATKRRVPARALCAALGVTLQHAVLAHVAGGRAATR